MSVASLEAEKRKYVQLVNDLNGVLGQLRSASSNVSSAKTVDANYVVNDSSYSCGVLDDVESFINSEIDTLTGTIIPSANARIQRLNSNITSERKAEEEAARAADEAQAAAVNASQAVGASIASRVSNFIGRRG